MALDSPKRNWVNKNVRPVLYVDSAIIAKMKELENSLPSDPEERDRNNGPRLANELILLIKPLIFPLLENEEKQGFMWEREWRYGNLGDFEFDYNDIEIICCPKEEREAIANILGDAIENINFIETWTQYDAIKKFLKSREPCWEEKIRKCEKEELDKLKIELKVELHKLTAYKNIFDFAKRREWYTRAN
ncbi:hypothetical protein [Legionella maceachernii]|uniref:hypothetical protein n=1 Tax=Legionella maceachernii TaxID=466 RepID=UPI000E1BD5CD|nr:hypothetical protein [Legionella maceachernii]